MASDKLVKKPEESGKVLYEHTGYKICEGKIYHVAVLSENNLLVIGLNKSIDRYDAFSFSDVFVRVWSLSERKFIRELSGAAEGGISSYVVLPNGLVAIRTVSNIIRFFDYRSGKCLYSNDRNVSAEENIQKPMRGEDLGRFLLFSEHQLAVLPNHILASCEKGVIKLWDYQTGKLTQEIKEVKGQACERIIAYPGGKLLVNSWNKTYILELAAGQCTSAVEIEKTQLEAALTEILSAYYKSTPDKTIWFSPLNVQSTGKIVFKIWTSDSYGYRDVGIGFYKLSAGKFSTWTPFSTGYSTPPHALTKGLLLVGSINTTQHYIERTREELEAGFFVAMHGLGGDYSTTKYFLTLIDIATGKIVEQREVPQSINTIVSLPDGAAIYAFENKLNIIRSVEKVLAPTANDKVSDNKEVLEELCSMRELLLKTQQDLAEARRYLEILQGEKQVLEMNQHSQVAQNEKQEQILANAREVIQQLSEKNDDAEKKLKKLEQQFSVTIASGSIQRGERLGEGSYGVVYKGSYYGEVAVKVLSNQNMNSSEIKDFENEVSLMLMCRSSHIVQILGACFERGHYSIVMEYMPKGSLYDLLKDNSHELGWSTRYQISIDVGEGLSFLHAIGILHRDLKSPNILLDNHLRAKITDFGLAKIKLNSNSTAKSGKIIGTTRWLAPELMDSEGPSSPTKASDVYSYGMVMWEITSREIPFKKAQTDAIAALWIMNKKKESIPEGTPARMAHLITQCWKQHPEERPPIKNVVTELKEEQKSLCGIKQ